MIVKDSRSPRGRYEESHLFPSVVLLKTIGAAMPEEGMTWMSRNAETRPSRAPRPPQPLPRFELVCAECDSTFMTAHPTYARYCGGTCRMRANRRTRLEAGWRPKRRAA